MKYKPSYYNLVVEHGPWTLLFNGVTSGLVKLPHEFAELLLPFLGPPRPRTAERGRSQWRCKSFEAEDLPQPLWDVFSELGRGGFFVPSEKDELAALKARYEYYRANDPFLVTIATTMDCNLGCYYCFEDKSKTYLTKEGCDRILTWVKERIEAEGHDRLYTDWYGGEPMLNWEAIGYFSDKIISYCEARGITYSSSIISNGTLWPDDAASFIRRTLIRHVQFTLDGSREHHNKRRQYISVEDKGRSSFDEIASVVDKLMGRVRIYLRINVDPWVGRSCLSLLDFFEQRGWFRHGGFYPYLAMVGPMTEHCSFLGASQRVRDFRGEFDQLSHEFQCKLARYIDPRGVQHLQYYPMTVKINCAAVGHNSVIFGPDGSMYKCGLEVGDQRRAHGRLLMEARRPGGDEEIIPLVNISYGASANDWAIYDPFSHLRCSECQYLPVCMGGCPKAHFDQNEFYLEQQGRYWEENFDSLIRTYYDTTARQAIDVGFKSIPDMIRIRTGTRMLGAELDCVEGPRRPLSY